MGESYRNIIGQELPEGRVRMDFCHHGWKAKRVSSGSCFAFPLLVSGLERKLGWNAEAAALAADTTALFLLNKNDHEVLQRIK